MDFANCSTLSGIFCLSSLGNGIRIFHNCPPSNKQNACPFGNCTKSPGVSSGTSLVTIRSSLLEVKSAPCPSIAASVTEEKGCKIDTGTEDNLSVNKRAVASSNTRRQTKVFKLPATCPA